MSVHILHVTIYVRKYGFYHTDQVKTIYLKRALVCKYINITEELTLYYEGQTVELSKI